MKKVQDISSEKSSHVMRLVCSLILAGSVTLSASAQNAVKLYSLEDCVNEAVNNNMKLRNADNQITMSAEQRKEAFTKYFPSISATGAGFIADKGLLQLDMGGMNLSMAKDGITAAVTAMQPIFAGGQLVNSNKLAKLGEETSRLQKGLTENEIRLNAESYYWQIVQLKEKLRTLNQLDKQLESVLNDAQTAVDAGIRNRNDVLQVQLRKNEVRTSHIQVENALAVSKDLLAQVMGHSNENLDVSYSLLSDNNKEEQNATNTPMPESPQRFFQSTETSLSQTHEYQLLDKQIEASQLQYKLAVGKNLPSIAVGGGYLFNNIMDKSQNNLVGLLTVSIPISNWWGGSHEMKRHKLQVASAVNEKKDQSEMLVIRMRKAWNDVNDAYKQVEIAKESIMQSEENLRLNTDYYQAGTATISDLLDAQTLYQQSHDKYVESFTNYEIKKREYLQATGR